MGFLKSIRLAILLTVTTLSCSMIPAQDCGNIINLSVMGTVADADGNPVENAQIVIESVQESRCYKAASFETLMLVTDENGRFTGVIPIISEDEGIALRASAPGYQDTERRGTYVLFDDDLAIALLAE